MTKVLVLYHSNYGHIETMAGAIAEGARSIEGVEVTIKRVPETLSPEAAAASADVWPLTTSVTSAAPPLISAVTRMSMTLGMLVVWRRMENSKNRLNPSVLPL